MKKLFTILLLSIVLFSCKKTSKVTNLPTDPELVNIDMDRKAEAFRKGHNPHDNPPPPPPTTIHKACWLIDANGYDVPAGIWSSTGFYCAAGVSGDLATVKSYWSQFDVEITTDEALYNTYPVNKRMRVVVTSTNFYGSVGGVAYINSLNWADQEKQCFVFSSLLGNNIKYISDAMAHEMGHTANCYHHVELRNDEFGACYVYSPYLWSYHIMGASYYDANPIFTTGQRGCDFPTDDIFNINNSINQ